jgi:replicative DNA helicase Mcm
MSAEAEPRSVDEVFANTVGEEIVVDAQVVQRSTVSPKLEVAYFDCRQCGFRHPEPIRQGYGRIQPPAGHCEGCGLKGHWTVRKADSEFVDLLQVRLQQLPEELAKGEAETIDAVLKGPLARNGPESGQRVRMCAENIAITDGSTQFDDLLEARQVTTEAERQQVDPDRHREELDALAAAPDTFGRLVDSVAPEHMGDRHIKAGLVLQLVRAASGDAFRETIHQAAIGDYGTGKTNFGDALTTLEPRSKKASANQGTSSAGLTAAVTKDGPGDGWSVSAGALPQCHDGAVFIDELDEASDTVQGALLEAAESEKITVQKGGVEATLAASTCIFAAANPEGGHVSDDAAPIDQTDITLPLLDRMDLIWVPEAAVEREEIEAIAGHIVDGRDVDQREHADAEVPEDLRDEVGAAVDEDVFRAYLQEARDIQPTFADETVKTALTDWYVETKTRLVSEQREDEGDVRISPRAQQDVVRLAEASAKARHSETIDIEDAERATRLKARSYAELGVEVDLSDVVVESDGEGGLAIDAESPPAAIRQAVEQLRMESRDYGAEPAAVAQEVGGNPDVAVGPTEVRERIEAMLEEDSLAEVGDGRVVVA